MTYVDRTWVPSPDAYGSRADRTAFVYRAFIPELIADWRPNIAAELVGELEAAAVEVRELQVQPAFAGLEAASRQLLRAEALASSRIEGLEIGHRRIAAALADGETPDETARSVIANIAAMDRSIRVASELREITSSDVLDIHDALLVLPRERPYAGAWREQQNWIGTSSMSPRGAEFIPPPEGRVPGLMEDLLGFVNRDDMSPIVKAAVAHAQFETIHPFVDGNGRVGRALIHIVLRRDGVASRVVPPISVVLATNQRRYIEGLTAFRSGDVDGWIRLFVRALRDAVAASKVLGEKIAELQVAWRDRAGARAGSAPERLLAILAANPVVSARTVERMLDVSYPTANAAIARLASAEILRPIRANWRRNRLWEAPAVLALLDAFDAARATPTRHSERRRPAPRIHQGVAADRRPS